MRSRAASILLVAALTLMTGAVTAVPAGAVGGTTCQSVRGVATFKPGLPKNGGPKVKTTITIKGAHLGTCKTVSSGTLDATLKAKVAGNCKSFSGGADLKFSGTATITWKNNDSSTIAVKLIPRLYYGRRAQQLTGRVTSGKFLGSTLSSPLTSFSNGRCPLTSANIADNGYLTIH
jgi:hypothetical protein